MPQSKDLEVTFITEPSSIKGVGIHDTGLSERASHPIYDSYMQTLARKDKGNMIVATQIDFDED